MVEFHSITSIIPILVWPVWSPYGGVPGRAHAPDRLRLWGAPIAITGSRAQMDDELYDQSRLPRILPKIDKTCGRLQKWEGYLALQTGMDGRVHTIVRGQEQRS